MTIVRRPGVVPATLLAAGIPPVLARVYSSRGIVDAAAPLFCLTIYAPPVY